MYQIQKRESCKLKLKQFENTKMLARGVVKENTEGIGDIFSLFSIYSTGVFSQRSLQDFNFKLHCLMKLEDN